MDAVHVASEHFGLVRFIVRVRSDLSVLATGASAGKSAALDVFLWAKRFSRHGSA